jgi:hypothetical protein
MFGPVAADRWENDEGFRTLNALADFKKGEIRLTPRARSSPVEVRSLAVSVTGE